MGSYGKRAKAKSSHDLPIKDKPPHRIFPLSFLYLYLYYYTSLPIKKVYCYFIPLIVTHANVISILRIS